MITPSRSPYGRKVSCKNSNNTISKHIHKHEQKQIIMKIQPGTRQQNETQKTPAQHVLAYLANLLFFSPSLRFVDVTTEFVPRSRDVCFVQQITLLSNSTGFSQRPPGQAVLHRCLPLSPPGLNMPPFSTHMGFSIPAGPPFSSIFWLW